MALRNIVQSGDPVLSKTCRPVTSFDTRLAQLLDDMAETMLDANGLGLAAPQVGVLRRAFVALDEPAPPEGVEDAPEDVQADPPKVLEFINPEIVVQEGEVLAYEGCLSFPGQYGAIARPAKVTVKAQDRDGSFFTLEAEGMLARCICHETNHLDGVTIDSLAEYFYDPDVPHPLDDDFVTEPEEDIEAKE